MTIRKDEDRAALLAQAIRLKKAAARSPAPEMPQRPEEAPAYVSAMQHSLWLVQQMDRLSPAYNLTSAFRVSSALDVSELQRALNEIVSRHRLLRSSFRAQGEHVVQIVHDHSPMAVEVIEAADGEGEAIAAREASRPFDLETGPLMRLLLVEESGGHERILLLLMHHMLADERSLAYLWKELAEAYAGRLSSGAPPVQYDDFVHWLGEQSPAERRDEIDYWLQRLDPLPNDLRLPFEKPTVTAGSAPGRLLCRALSSAERTSIREVAAATDVTPFAVYAFAFRLLLHRYSDEQRTAFATPVSTRSHPATAEMIGYFSNPIVIAADIDERQHVQRSLREFGGELRDFLAHSSVPFEEIVEALSPPRERDRHPIFQAMFVYQEASPPPRLGDARLEPVVLDLGAAKFDLTLFVTEGEGSLEIAVEYRSDRFDEVWMRNLLGHYQTLIRELPANLGRATAELPMLDANELSELRARAMGPELKTEPLPPLPRLILDQSLRLPECEAVVSGGDRRSYRELQCLARSILDALADRGVGPGDRVAVFVERSARMIAGILACHQVGAAYVPLDPSYPAARNRDIIEDAEVAAVLTTSAVRDRLPAGPWPAIDIDSLDPGEEPSRALADPAAEDPAYILYTSGSTGRPKGVVVTHDNLRSSTAARLQVYEAPPGRFLLIPSIAFDSSVAGIFWTLAEASTLVIPTEDEVRDPRLLAKLVKKQKVSSLLCVPSLYAQLLKAGGDALEGLEIAIVAGESCTSRLVEEHFEVLPRTRLFNEYGPTEATVWATVHEFAEEDVGRPVEIGRPIPGVRVDLLDGLGRPVPAGIPGHAWIAGPTVAQGYWRRRDMTEERFVPEAANGASAPRYRTGDLMAWTADGRLRFLGREDEQIKLRGFRIEPGEIEAVLLERPEIEEAAVVARAATAGTSTAAVAEAEQLAAFVEGHDSDALDGWRQALAEYLPDHMIPSRLVRLPELPRLPNGKIDRRRLRHMELHSDLPTPNEQPIADNLEQALISLWEALLGRSGIAPTDNFFELGGHSLLVVEMTLAMERDFEVTLAVADVFENPTVRELSRRIEQRGGSKSPPYRHLFPIQPAGRKMPFIVAVPHFFTEMFATRFRGERPVYGMRGVSLRPEGNRGQWRTMKELGEELADEIQRRFPGETCIVAGYSFGASMAIETVRVLEGRGVAVHGLYLIAPMPLDFYRFGPFRAQIDRLSRPVDELSLGEVMRLYARGNNPLTRRPYARAWRWLVVQPWRRLLCFVGTLRSMAGLQLTPRILHADVRVERFRLHGQYRPGHVHTPTVIFNAANADTDAAATWRPYFPGPFTVIPTPDPHAGDASVEAARDVILRHLTDLEDS
jgi:amino acid adenylation domain-containing protein